MRNSLVALAVAGTVLLAACGGSSDGGTPAVVVSPAASTVAPRGTLTFTASGGTGSGYTFALATNASGGSINTSSGAYVAGATGGVTDVVRVTDSGGNSGTASVTVSAGVSITPATASVAPHGAITFLAGGGSGTGYTWALTTNASGATLDASTGAYVAGGTPSVTDVVRCTDSLGNTASRDITVGAGVSLSPATATVPPRGSQGFTASGGSGTYTWVISTNNSGGAISASGAYLAGATPSVTDILRAEDGLGNSATATVTVGAGVSVSPATAGVAPGGSQTFTATGGSGGPYTWSISTNASGGSITSGGAYTAGNTPNVSDVIRAEDALGNTATATVNVSPNLTITASANTVAPRGGISFSATGGTGTGFTWSLATNASGGSINSSTGAYVAGSTGGVTDVVQVRDSGNHTATQSVTVTAGVSISPATVVLRRNQAQTLIASGGSATGYSWSLTSNVSGGSITTTSGQGSYTSGNTAGTDVAQVTDSLGNTATRNITVTPAATIAPASIAVLTGGSQTFTGGAGSGSGYAYSLAANNSGGTINATSGAYVAGSTGNVTDTVRVTDSVGNTADATVTVMVPIVISPPSASVFTGASQTFTASGGSGNGYAWSLATNNSGGTINPTSGAYVAGSTTGVSDVVRVTDSLSGTATTTVSVLAYVVQRWNVPQSWGGNGGWFWPDADATLVEHSRFVGTSPGIPQETKNITWTAAGTGTVPRSTFTGFGYPVTDTTRNGAGPFPATGGRYQAQAGTDSALNLTGNMLVCAVVRPGFDPTIALDGQEKIVIAKGTRFQSGWMLMQMHDSWCFHYTSVGAIDGMRFTGTYVPNDGYGNASKNASFVVVCGGRDDTDAGGSQIRIAVNSVASLSSTSPYGALVTSSDAATIGGYTSGADVNQFQGMVYETAVWNIPATPANIQAKMAAVLGTTLPDGTVATYSRNHEGFYRGADNLLHGAWRHGPRIDRTNGFLFGLQGVNEVVNTSVHGGTLPELLNNWTSTLGASASANVNVAVPGDSGNNPFTVTLPAGASLSALMSNFAPLPAGVTSGPIYPALWIYPYVAGGDSTSGTLRIRTTVPGTPTPVPMGYKDVDLAGLNPSQWNYVWANSGSGPGLTTDGKPTEADQGTVHLENTGATPIQFTAWGVDVAQYGGPGGVGYGFTGGDAVPVPASWSPDFYFYDSLKESNAVDRLQLPPVPASTAPSGFCLAVHAQPAAGLPWATAFSQVRALAQWVGPGTDLVYLFAGAQGGVPGSMVFRVDSGGTSKPLTFTYPGTWTNGSDHVIKACVTAAGVMYVYGDDVQLATAPLSTGQPVPDLGTGYLVVGNEQNGSYPWQGWVRSALVCRFTGDPTTCQ